MGQFTGNPWGFGGKKNVVSGETVSLHQSKSLPQLGPNRCSKLALPTCRQKATFAHNNTQMLYRNTWMWQSQYNRPIIWGCLKSHKNGTWGYLGIVCWANIWASWCEPSTHWYETMGPNFADFWNTAKREAPTSRDGSRAPETRDTHRPYLRISWGFSNPKWGYNREISNRISLYKKGLCFFSQFADSQMLVLQSLSATAKGLVARQHVVQALTVETPKKYW